MDKNEINPRLKKQLDQLGDVPWRGLQASHSSRENYLAQVRSLKPRPAGSRSAGKRTAPVSRRSWVGRLAAIGAVLLVALSSLGGTAYAAQASGPDDLLYGVKTFTEEIQVGLESDPKDRLDLYVSFASRRLNEIQAQVDAGEPVSQKALALLEKHTHQMLQEAAGIGQSGVEQALRQVQQALELQNQVMTRLQKQTPGGGEPGLVKAQETIQSRLRLVENGINEPQGFQEQMRNEGSNQGGQGPGSGKSDDPGKSGEAPGLDPDHQPGGGKPENPREGRGDQGTDIAPGFAPGSLPGQAPPFSQ